MYEPDDLVLVKLKQGLWWPTQVVSPDNCPIYKAKKFICYVKFLQENKYKEITKHGDIKRFDCPERHKITVASSTVLKKDKTEGGIDTLLLFNRDLATVEEVMRKRLLGLHVKTGCSSDEDSDLDDRQEFCDNNSQPSVNTCTMSPLSNSSDFQEPTTSTGKKRRNTRLADNIYKEELSSSSIDFQEPTTSRPKKHSNKSIIGLVNDMDKEEVISSSYVDFKEPSSSKVKKRSYKGKIRLDDDKVTNSSSVNLQEPSFRAKKRGLNTTTVLADNIYKEKVTNKMSHNGTDDVEDTCASVSKRTRSSQSLMSTEEDTPIVPIKRKKLNKFASRIPDLLNDINDKCDSCGLPDLFPKTGAQKYATGKCEKVDSETADNHDETSELDTSRGKSNIPKKKVPKRAKQKSCESDDNDMPVLFPNKDKKNKLKGKTKKKKVPTATLR